MTATTAREQGERIMDSDFGTFISDLVQEIVDLVFNQLLDFLMGLIFGEPEA